MTRATYNTDNTITELPGPKPEKYPEYLGKGTDAYYLYTELWKKYNAHLATLRTLVCSPECRGLWKPGQVLAEGKDYEVREVDWMPETEDEYNQAVYESKHELAGPVPKVLTAFPLPVKSEDDLWYKAIDLIMVAHDKGLSKEDAIAEVKSQFIITKR